MDSPLFSFLNKVADLIYLNILTFICCIPIITIGASITALNYVVLKIARNEEGYITRSFFKSFKENFRQATIIWLIILLLAAVLIGDFYIIRFSSVPFPAWMPTLLAAVGLLLIFATMHVFPVLSRFENTIKHTFKNSLYMGILTFPKTVLMIVCWVIPVIVGALSFRAMPFVLMLGISGPAFLCAKLYDKTFKRFEPQVEAADDHEWSIPLEEGENDCTK